MSKKKEKKTEEKQQITLKQKVFLEPEFVSALETLKWLKIGKSASLETHTKIRRMLRAIKPFKEDFNELRIELAKEYGEHDEERKQFIFPDKEKEKLFNEKVEELKKITFTIEHAPFPLPGETQMGMTNAELMALEDYGLITPDE